ncbi:MAG TPA: N-acetylmuramic acid 6-phosphate etherase [Gemmatimonadales bacterium]
MTRSDFFDPRLTERRNPNTIDIDVASARTIVALLNTEDRRVPEAVAAAADAIADVIDLVEQAFRRGGRLLYVGAGTSGRLGVLDAAECPPTFGTPPTMVLGIIAGGPDALVASQEGAEDDDEAGARVMDDHAVRATDVVVGIAASGTTPFVAAALRRAQQRGARTALVTCADPPAAVRTSCDRVIAVMVGPEALTGSTRLKAGTATKLVLNTITTGAMIRVGKAYGNLMIDLRELSAKLLDRGERIVMEVCDVDRTTARAAINAAYGNAKRAIVMLRRGVGAEEADAMLKQAGGFIRRVIGDPPPVRDD